MFKITLTPGQFSTRELTEHDCSLEELVELCTTFEVGEKDGVALIPARFQPCPTQCRNHFKKSHHSQCAGEEMHRLNENVTEMSALGLDIDDVTEAQQEAILDSLQARGLAFIAWHTHSHRTPESAEEASCRFRLLLPFTKPLPVPNADDWSRIFWPALIRSLNLPTPVDRACCNTARIYFLPRKPTIDSPHRAVFVPGALFDWEPVVGHARALLAEKLATITAPSVDNERPVDLDVIRERLARIRSGYGHPWAAATLLERVLQHKSPTDAPGVRAPDAPPRREAWRIVTVTLANVADGWESSNVLLELLRPSWKREVTESPNDHTPWETIEGLFESARESAPTYHAKQAAKNEAWLSKFRELMAGRSRVAVPTSGPVETRGDVPFEAAPIIGDEPLWPCTERGLVAKFVWHVKDKLHWIPEWHRWLVWDGTRWKNAVEEDAQRAMSEVMRLLEHDAARAASREQAQEILKWYVKCQCWNVLDKTLKLARHELCWSPDSLDRDNWLLNVQNGVVDLRTGKLLPHSSERRITRLAPVTFDPEATAPRWHQYGATSLTPDLWDYLQTLAGYTLTGSVQEHSLYFLHGLGDNGKSTFILTLRELLGDYAVAGAPNLLLAKTNEEHPTELAGLAGHRLIICNEVEEGRAFAEAKIKQLVSGDVIRARFMYQEFFDFIPTYKIWVAGNDKPTVRGTDDGIWRRIKLIPFNVKVPADKKDKSLQEKLNQELSGILNWAIAGCLRWQKSGMDLPCAVKNATEGYRSDQDFIGDFVDECLELTQSETLLPGPVLYRRYVLFCDSHGERPWSMRALSRALRRKGLVPTRSTTSRGFKGVVLRGNPTPTLKAVQ